jgi:hypothetical protein
VTACIRVSGQEVPVENGILVDIKITTSYIKVTWNDGKLYILAPKVELVVDAVNSSGNSSQLIVEPDFTQTSPPSGKKDSVTGVGMFVTPENSIPEKPSDSGVTSFSLACKYNRSGDELIGSFYFRFYKSRFCFLNTSYDSMAIQGNGAVIYGQGKINGRGNYGFFISVIDAEATGSKCYVSQKSDDKIRIKVWDITSGDVLYDNEMGEEDTAPPGITLKYGNIKIQE